MKTKYVYKSSDFYFFFSSHFWPLETSKITLKGNKEKNANLHPLPSRNTGWLLTKSNTHQTLEFSRVGWWSLETGTEKLQLSEGQFLGFITPVFSKEQNTWF
jgi:hypothetical protein